MPAKKWVKKPGLPPESIVYVGEKPVEKIKIEIIDYTAKKLQIKTAKKVEEYR